MENVVNDPTQKELIELVDKQEVVINHLSEKLEATNALVIYLRDAVFCESASDCSWGAALCEKEVKSTSPFVQLLARVKEVEFCYAREQTKSANLLADLKFQKFRFEELRSDFASSDALNESSVFSITSKLEETTEQLAELRAKYQSTQSEKETALAELNGELKLAKERSENLQIHCSELSGEVCKLRAQLKVAYLRIATLLEENTVYREKATNGSDRDLDEEQVQKLLKEQSDLIHVLKKEGQLLMNQLLLEKRVNRKKNPRFEERETWVAEKDSKCVIIITIYHSKESRDCNLRWNCGLQISSDLPQFTEYDQENMIFSKR